MDAEGSFRGVIHKVAQGLNSDNVKMIAYLCMDCIPSGRIFSNSIEIFDLFEVKGLISSTEMSFLAEVLYRINRHDLLKQLPGVKNRRDYEENFLQQQRHQNFTPYRIACLRLVDELTKSDFQTLRNLCKDKLSSRNYQRSIDVLSLLICLEEEDYMSDGDLEFILSSLQHLDNQIPFRIFERLRQGDTSITLPTRHPSAPNLAANNLPFLKSKGFAHAQSLPYFNYGNTEASGAGSSYGVQPYSFNTYPEVHEYTRNVFQCNNVGVPVHKGFVELPYEKSNPGLTNRAFSGASSDPPNKNAVNPCNERNNNFGYPSDHIGSIGFENGLSWQHCHDRTEDSTFVKPVNTNDRVMQIQHSRDNSADMHQRCPIEGQMQTLEIGENHNHESTARYCFESMLGNQLGQPREPSEISKSFVDNRNFSDSIRSTEDEMSKDCYSMKKDPHGICLIINNYIFEGSINEEDAVRRLNISGIPVPNVGLKDRSGSRRDVENIKDLFGSLGFVVEVYNDLTEKEMKKTITDFSHKDHSNYDCFVVFIMSHGLEGSVYGVDGLQVSCTQIVKTFRPDKCPSLLDKPKIFFFQACQGDRKMEGHSAPVADMDIEADSAQQDYTYVTPTEADFLIAHSTVPGYLSYRHKKNGSWFIDILIQNLKKYHQSEDLLSILIKVNNEMSTQPFKQMPMPIATLRKKVFLQKRNYSASTLAKENFPYPTEVVNE